MKRSYRAGLAFPLLLLTLVACSDPAGIDLRKVTFAPALDVDLDAMTQTPSGLYYQDLEVGAGTVAVAGQRVSVLYRGWLADGALFDEAQDPASPFRFWLGFGSVIQGWDEGVAGMRVGGVRKLVIPPSLGYGDKPMGRIPANSVLVFEVTLLGVG
jgi:FKBP-type peptidyl-prolyl cis-trans isomerase FkpA